MIIDKGDKKTWNEFQDALDDEQRVAVSAILQSIGLAFQSASLCMKEGQDLDWFDEVISQMGGAFGPN